jgi:Ni/Co efflux regulator RcnB
MKALFVGVLSLGLVAGTGAWAQQEHHNNGGGGGGGSHEQHGGGGHESGGMSAHHSEGGHMSEHHVTEHRDVDVHKNVEVHRNVDVHHGGYESVHVGIHGGGGVHVGIKGGARLGHFHAAFRAPHRFHARAWVAPRGFHYRRFSVGERIPGILLAADFFLDDYAAYGLEYPGTEYVWVRDGDDAVLVDRYTGDVIEVEYDVFY